MRSTQLRRLGLLVGLAAVSLAPHRARGCDSWPDCMMLFHSPDKVFRNADMVFRGRLLEYRPPPERPEHINDLGDVRDFALEPFRSTSSAEIEVDEAWKGVDHRFVTLRTNAHSCYGDLLKIEPGTDLLVFAHQNPEGGRQMWVDICFRALPVEHEWAQAALDYLGPGKRDLPEHDWRKILLRTVGLVVVIGIALALVSWRRRSRDQQTQPPPST